MSEHFLGSNKAFEILANLGLDPLVMWLVKGARNCVVVAAKARPWIPMHQRLPSYIFHPILMLASCGFHPLHHSTCQSLVPSTLDPNYILQAHGSFQPTTNREWKQKHARLIEVKIMQPAHLSWGQQIDFAEECLPYQSLWVSVGLSQGIRCSMDSSCKLPCNLPYIDPVLIRQPVQHEARAHLDGLLSSTLKKFTATLWVVGW
jgi:hypothetical protein